MFERKFRPQQMQFHKTGGVVGVHRRVNYAKRKLQILTRFRLNSLKP